MSDSEVRKHVQQHISANERLSVIVSGSQRLSGGRFYISSPSEVKSRCRAELTHHHLTVVTELQLLMCWSPNKQAAVRVWRLMKQSEVLTERRSHWWKKLILKELFPTEWWHHQRSDWLSINLTFTELLCRNLLEDGGWLFCLLSSNDRRHEMCPVLLLVVTLREIHTVQNVGDLLNLWNTCTCLFFLLWCEQKWSSCVCCGCTNKNNKSLCHFYIKMSVYMPVDAFLFIFVIRNWTAVHRCHQKVSWPWKHVLMLFLSQLIGAPFILQTSFHLCRSAGVSSFGSGKPRRQEQRESCQRRQRQQPGEQHRGLQ